MRSSGPSAVHALLFCLSPVRSARGRHPAFHPTTASWVLLKRRSLAPSCRTVRMRRHKDRTVAAAKGVSASKKLHRLSRHWGMAVCTKACTPSPWFEDSARPQSNTDRMPPVSDAWNILCATDTNNTIQAVALRTLWGRFCAAHAQRPLFGARTAPVIRLYQNQSQTHQPPQTPHARGKTKECNVLVTCHASLIWYFL